MRVLAFAMVMAVIVPLFFVMFIPVNFLSGERDGAPPEIVCR